MRPPNPNRKQRMKKARAKNSQHEQFVDKARELGCDEDEAVFEAKLRRIAKPKPHSQKKEPAK